MFDLRNIKKINLDNAECLKPETTYKFKDSATGKNLIAKLIAYYDDSEDLYLIAEFKKLVLLSGEPEIGTVYYLATSEINHKEQSCYVMEEITGKTLSSFLKERENIIYEVAVDILSQIASGIEKAHHFDITHSDLHNENILINNSGFIKIIDFLWWDYSLPIEDNKNADLTDFKRLSQELFEKCNSNDKKRLGLINTHIQKITSFKGLVKEIEILNEISLDISLIDDESIVMLNQLFQATAGLYELKVYVSEKNYDIPIKHIPVRSESEEKLYQQTKSGSRLQYIDTRSMAIEDNLKSLFNEKLYNLKQTGLVDWNLWITNEGPDFEGPYKLNYQIWFTSKFFHWKKAQELLEIIHNQSDDRSLEQIILD